MSDLLQFRTARSPDGKWLLLEDVKETPYRIDRHLAALKLGQHHAAANEALDPNRPIREADIAANSPALVGPLAMPADAIGQSEQ